MNYFSSKIVVNTSSFSITEQMSSVPPLLSKNKSIIHGLIEFKIQQKSSPDQSTQRRIPVLSPVSSCKSPITNKFCLSRPDVQQLPLRGICHVMLSTKEKSCGIPGFIKIILKTTVNKLSNPFSLLHSIKQWKMGGFCCTIVFTWARKSWIDLSIEGVNSNCSV